MAAKVRGSGMKPKPRKPRASGPGRPSSYTREIADAICLRLAEGETLRKICAEPTMPGRSSVLRWLGQNTEFRDQYARARELQADSLAEDVVAIADDRSGDVVSDGKGGKNIDWENVQRSRLRCDARKWLAAKVAPKKYGERLATELSGPNGGPIVTEQSPSWLPPTEVAAQVQQLFAEVEQELELSDGAELPPGERLKRILASDQPLDPRIYASLYGAKHDA